MTSVDTFKASIATLSVVGGAVEKWEACDGVGGRMLQHVQVLARLRLGVSRPHAPEQASHLETRGN